jgi:hypothetical protein
LSVNSDLSVFSNLSNADLNIISQAFSRLDINQKNGLIQIKQTSGSQVNISENLFVFIKNQLDNSSKYREIKPNVPRLKQDGESTIPNLNNCVAYSVSRIMAQFGVTTSVSTIDTYYQSQYGTNGIPSGSLATAAQTYLNGYTTTSIPPSGSKAIVVLKIGHAINFFSASGNFIWGKDFQNPTSSGAGDCFITLSEVAFFFVATSAK